MSCLGKSSREATAILVPAPGAAGRQAETSAWWERWITQLLLGWSKDIALIESFQSCSFGWLGYNLPWELARAKEACVLKGKWAASALEKEGIPPHWWHLWSWCKVYLACEGFGTFIITLWITHLHHNIVNGSSPEHNKEESFFRAKWVCLM